MPRLVPAAVLSIVAFAAVPAIAPAAAPPLPKAANGARVSVLARGIPTPTSVAFVGRTTFVTAGGTEDGKTAGGVFLVRGGRAKRLAGTPRFVAGAVGAGGTLYVSAGPNLLAMSGWSGSRFRHTRTVWRGPRGFAGLNGLALGPDGRIYAGTALNDRVEFKRSGPYDKSVISIARDGRSVFTVARGLRQPWQLTFVRGIAQPFVSVLGQDNLGENEPPDWIVRATRGQDYGYPRCTWAVPAACRGFAKPAWLLRAHASPMGISSIRSTLYVALFGGLGKGPAVARLSSSGRGRIATVLSGFPAPVVALTTRQGHIYVGDLTGAVYRVAA